jgi:DNA-directed RNA polymerase specialized sigma24 family protein
VTALHHRQDDNRFRKEALAAAIKGDRRAQRIVYDAAVSFAKRYVWAIIGGRRPGSDDLAHDIAALALLDLPSYRFESRFSTWIYSITRRQVIAMTRATARLQLLADVLITTAAEEEHCNSPEDRMAHADELCRTACALVRLHPRRRFCLLALRASNGTAAGVARKVGTSGVAVRQMAFKAAAQLRRVLTRDGLPCDHPACQACSRRTSDQSSEMAPPASCPVREILAMAT